MSERSIQVRLDPTLTTPLQKRFESELVARFRRLGRDIRAALGDNPESFSGGMKQNAAALRIDRFPSDASKLEEFNAWLQDEIDRGILNISAEGRPLSGRGNWTDVYIDAAYKQGMRKGYADARRAGKVTDSQILPNPQDYLVRPIHAETVKLLYVRAFDELKGVSDNMAQVIRRSLAESLAEGRGAKQAARILEARINSSNLTPAEREEFKIRGMDTIDRARLLARSEIVRAYNDSKLKSYEDSGIDAVGLDVEIVTSNDARVCAYCDDLARGGPYSLEQARGLLPAHPNCHCTWIVSTDKYTGKREEVA